MCVMALSVHHVATRQRRKMAAGTATARRRRSFIFQPYMLGELASKASPDCWDVIRQSEGCAAEG